MEIFHLFLAVMLAVINYPIVYFVGRWIETHDVRRVYAPTAEKTQIAREQRNAIFTTPVHALIFIVVLTTGALHPATESWRVITLTFLIAFIWTEIWHYFSHRVMHHRRLLFLHREHHLSAITNPWTSVSFSFLEKFVFSLGIIGFMAMLSHLAPISVTGIAAYYVFYFFTNTLGHANF